MFHVKDEEDLQNSTANINFSAEINICVNHWTKFPLNDQKL